MDIVRFIEKIKNYPEFKKLIENTNIKKWINEFHFQETRIKELDKKYGKDKENVGEEFEKEVLKNIIPKIIKEYGYEFKDVIIYQNLSIIDKSVAVKKGGSSVGEVDFIICEKSKDVICIVEVKNNINDLNKAITQLFFILIKIFNNMILGNSEKKEILNKNNFKKYYGSFISKINYKLEKNEPLKNKLDLKPKKKKDYLKNIISLINYGRIHIVYNSGYKEFDEINLGLDSRVFYLLFYFFWNSSYSSDNIDDYSEKYLEKLFNKIKNISVKMNYSPKTIYELIKKSNKKSLKPNLLLSV